MDTTALVAPTVTAPPAPPEPEPECEHLWCHAEPEAGMDCLRGLDRCCGCCHPDRDAAWEAAQEW